MNGLSENMLIKFTFVVFKVAEISLPAYSCEYSKQTYTQHQLMALICLMKRLRLKYREIIEVVDLMPKLQEMIGLKEIPHFTTLQKLFKRFGSHFFDEILIKLWNYSILIIHGWQLMELGIQLTMPACITHIKPKNNTKRKEKVTPKTR